MHLETEIQIPDTFSTELIRIALDGFQRAIRRDDHLEITIYAPDADAADDEQDEREEALNAHLEAHMEGKDEVTLEELNLGSLPPDLRSDAIDLLTDILARAKRRAEKPRTLQEMQTVRDYGVRIQNELRGLLRLKKAA